MSNKNLVTIYKKKKENRGKTLTYRFLYNINHFLFFTNLVILASRSDFLTALGVWILWMIKGLKWLYNHIGLED